MAKFVVLESGSLRCVETGAVIPAAKKDAYASMVDVRAERKAKAPAGEPSKNELGEIVKAQAAIIERLNKEYADGKKK